MPPDSTGITADVLKASLKLRKLVRSPKRLLRARVLGPLGFRDSCGRRRGSESYVEAFAESITSCLDGERELELELEPGNNNVAMVVSSRVCVVKFFPTRDLEMVVAGDESGNVGFWDMRSKCVHRFRLHSGTVSGILVHPFSMSKVYTSSYDGIVRVMNMEKQVFDLVYLGDDSIYSLAQKSDNADSIYFSEGQEGVVKMWDGRMGKVSATWNLHEKRVNSVDFSSADTNIMSTSSADRTACIWDLRKMSTENSVMLKAAEHKGAVYSAYFSPSGTHLATTSANVGGNIGVVSGENQLTEYERRRRDNIKRNDEMMSALKIQRKNEMLSALKIQSKLSEISSANLQSVDGNIGVFSGKNFEHVSMIHHDTGVGTCPSSFRYQTNAIWGWDDAHLYIGNKSRGVDVLRVGQKKSICTLRSEHVASVSCRFDAHPWKVGALAGGAASGGQVYLLDTALGMSGNEIII